MGKVYTMLNTQCTALAEATEKIHAHWTFRDITGTIVRKGLSHEQLLTNCIKAPLPNHSTIGKVVDDETLLRIY